MNGSLYTNEAFNLSFEAPKGFKAVKLKSSSDEMNKQIAGGKGVIVAQFADKDANGVTVFVRNMGNDASKTDTETLSRQIAYAMAQQLASGGANTSDIQYADAQFRISYDMSGEEHCMVGVVNMSDDGKYAVWFQADAETEDAAATLLDGISQLR